MLVVAMLDLSSIFTLWLPILLASWVSFVKSSLQAAIFLTLIFLITGRFELFLVTGFLLFVSLLIPKPNPRHQKRRFQLGKAFYVFLAGYGVWTVSHYVPKVTPVILPTPDLTLEMLLIPAFAFFSFVVILLFSRHRHVS